MVEVTAGQVIAGHRLLERVGEGHFGEVWKAEYLGHTVALKLFTRPGKRSNLRREAFAQYALGRLGGEDGRYFPHVEHIELDQDPPYMRMEYLEGRPLEDLLSQPAMSLEQRLALGMRILEALTAVHRHGFVHGDLSPRNALATPDGTVKLIDVGYGALFDEGAQDLERSQDADERPLGVASPLYAAPERFKAEFLEGCGKPADVFSFGKILYRLVTGETPFVIKPVSMKFPILGRAWDDFLFRCLEEDPARRFEDATAALAEYRRLYQPEPAPGEFRAQCPECGARMSLPGGWAGERFPCHACRMTLEVLFYDEATRHASTAIVSDAQVREIEFVEDGAGTAEPAAAPETRARKFCPNCGGSIYAEAKKCRHCKTWVDEMARRLADEDARRRSADRQEAAFAAQSYVLPAVASFLAYFLFWIPGALLNWHFLREARLVERFTGRRASGHAALEVMMILFVYLPVTIVTGVAMVGVAVALISGALF